MSEKENNLYSEYFSFRNVESDFYSDYALPVYLENLWPTDREVAILDIGCGFGQTLKALRAKGYKDLNGIDISDEAVKCCISNNLEVTKIDSISAYCHNYSKKYDFIIMSHVLEHLEKSEIVETLCAIRTHLLKKGGSFVVMVPNAQSHTGCYWAYEDFTHTTLFTAGSLYFVLKSAGFESVEFIDPDALMGSRLAIKKIRKFLLILYKTNILFWNIVTNSSFHKPSPQIFSYELKALAK